MTARKPVTAEFLATLQPGTPVWYEARPGTKYPAVVANEPWDMGSGQFVVRLEGLPPEYARDTCRKATYVPCAATWCVTHRVTHTPECDAAAKEMAAEDYAPRCSCKATL